MVVTHHLPTMAVVAPEHKGNLLNSAFATELGDFIADSRIDAWIFGHSHANIDATINNTRSKAALIKNDILDNKAGEISFQDPIYAYWLKTEYFAK